MIGLNVYPDRTLGDRALDHMFGGPRSALELARDILGLASVSPIIAERLAIALLGADPRVRQLPDGRWAAVTSARETPRLADCTFAVVDVETTGVRSRSDDRITEIAVVVVSAGTVEVAFDSLVNPDRYIPASITSVTGITNEMVARAPRFAEVSDAVLAALSGRIFVAHNARFDWNFVDAELRRTRDLVLSGPRLCTVRLARRLVQGVQSCGLDSLTHWFGWENQARHRACGDAMVTAQLLNRLIQLAGDRGATTVDDLVAISTMPRRRFRELWS
ncbi:MAG TPA: 3'-5' exonuclease [Gemmatimonadales bacterium]|nr:3'-5' exonuclease [Gemmatimonadales bacterium]